MFRKNTNIQSIFFATFTCTNANDKSHIVVDSIVTKNYIQDKIEPQKLEQGLPFTNSIHTKLNISELRFAMPIAKIN